MKPLLRSVLARITGGDQRSIRWFEDVAAATVPEGGLAGQVLSKTTDDNFALQWASASGLVVWDDIPGKPDFADVATSGLYSDLFGLPTLFSGAYGDLTGIPSTFAPEAHNHPLSDLTVSGATLGQVPKWDGAAWVPATVGGGGISGAATVTVPSGSLTHVETFTATGVAPASLIFLAIGAHSDNDENSPELLDVSTISGTAGTDEITATLAFMTPTSGPINLNWSAL